METRLFGIEDVCCEKLALGTRSEGTVSVVVVFVKILRWIRDEILHALAILSDLLLNVSFIVYDIIRFLSYDLHFLWVIAILKHHRIA